MRETSEYEMSKSLKLDKISEGRFRLSSPYLVLEADDALDLEVEFRMLPLSLVDGEHMHGAYMDLESEDFKEIKAEAEKLKSLPERERPRKLIEILRSKVDYPYKWVVGEMKDENPEKFNWINKLKTGEAKLSECVVEGFAECGQFAALLLFLGNAAGLQGEISSYGPYRGEKTDIVNVFRTDTGEPLFKSIEVGEPLHEGHAWVEFLMSDGIWMPADPATRLVGDTKEGMDTFERANYQARIWIQDEGEKGLILDKAELTIRPGEGKAMGRVKIRSLRNDAKTGDRIKFEGPVKLDIFAMNEAVNNEMKVAIENIELV